MKKIRKSFSTTHFIQAVALSVFSLCFINLFGQTNKDISLNEIWASPTFFAKYPNSFRGMKDGETFCLAEKKENYTEVNRYKIKDGNKVGKIFSTASILVDSKPVKMTKFTFSKDEKMVLIEYNRKGIYRHSYTSDALIYNIETKKTQTLPKDVMYPRLSPDGTGYSYVKNNNLFFNYIDKKQEDRAITNDGELNKIRNGNVDWVYEEEFGMDIGYFWSPNSKYIAFYKFDEEEVPEFTMDVYGSLYPKRVTWKYPKAGEKNSKVDIYIYDISTNNKVKCKTNSEKDQYLPRMKWDKTGRYLTIQRLNRHQNKLEILVADPMFGNTDVSYTEKNNYYVEVHDWIQLDEEKWLHLSEKSGYNQLWCFNIKKKKDKQLSKGEFDIDGFYGYDENSKKAFFNAGIDKPTERQVYSVDNKGNLEQLTKGSGWHRASFINGFKYFLDNYSTIKNPPTHSLFQANGELVKVLEDNAALKERLAARNLGESTFGKFTNRYGTDLDYWMLKPANFDKNKKYPILFYVYGGPGFQTAKNAWGGANYLWHQMLAQKGYIIITVNNTGGGAQGEAFKKKTYLQLGNYETQDYIDAAKHFGNESYANASRIGIWGWSYGGFMSSNCITRGANYFKTAIAVAPVTSWRYYDNIYTERYMRTPQENAQGYDTNSPINHVTELKGNYLLVHGTGDDNVHFQNAVEMMLALNNNNIPYQSAVYPNKAHGISGGKTRLHLFTRMTKFILENL